MAYWYLIAALPYLRFGEKPAMSAEPFRAFCAGRLTADELQAVDSLLAGRPSASGPAAGWHEVETQVRNAAARIRGRRYNAAPVMRPHAGFQVAIEEGVADAFARDNPLEREMELDRLRWRLADDAAAADPFGPAGVLAYAVKLRIAERRAALDEAAGKKRVEEMVEAGVRTEDREGRKDA